MKKVFLCMLLVVIQSFALQAMQKVNKSSLDQSSVNVPLNKYIEERCTFIKQLKKSEKPFPSLKKLLNHYELNGKSYIPTSIYIIYGISYWLAFDKDELKKRNNDDDINVVSYGQTLFTIAERIRSFEKDVKKCKEKNKNGKSHNIPLLDLAFIPDINELLGDLLYVLPSLIASPIQRLHLSSNNLRQVPNSIAKLEDLLWLDISSNQLRKLPDCIKDLKKLKRLNIINNPVENMSAPE